MNLPRNIYLLPLVLICCLFIKCKNSNEVLTGIEEIDSSVEFTKKFEFKNHKDSAYTNVDFFYNKTMEDSAYLIGTTEKDNYIIRARGWSFNHNRTGNWFYEKVYKNQKVIIDSIVNYVVFCERNPKNTIRRFENNILQKSKGQFYEIDMKKEVRLGDTLYIDLDFSFDTLVYQKVAREFYLTNPPNIHDLCEASKYVVDSFPVINNSTKLRFRMDQKGNVLMLGYYYLVPKIQPKDNIEVQQVFTEIKFEVK